MSLWKKIAAIVGGAACGGLGVAAIVYPDQAVIFASVSGAIGLIITALTGVALVSGE